MVRRGFDICGNLCDESPQTLIWHRTKVKVGLTGLTGLQHRRVVGLQPSSCPLQNQKASNGLPEATKGFNLNKTLGISSHFVEADHMIGFYQSHDLLQALPWGEWINQFSQISRKSTLIGNLLYIDDSGEIIIYYNEMLEMSADASTPWWGRSVV